MLFLLFHVTKVNFHIWPGPPSLQLQETHTWWPPLCKRSKALPWRGGTSRHSWLNIWVHWGRARGSWYFQVIPLPKNAAPPPKLLLKPRLKDGKEDLGVGQSLYKYEVQRYEHMSSCLCDRSWRFVHGFHLVLYTCVCSQNVVQLVCLPSHQGFLRIPLQVVPLWLDSHRAYAREKKQSLTRRKLGLVAKKASSRFFFKTRDLLGYFKTTMPQSIDISCYSCNGYF